MLRRREIQHLKIDFKSQYKTKLDTKPLKTTAKPDRKKVKDSILAFVLYSLKQWAFGLEYLSVQRSNEGDADNEAQRAELYKKEETGVFVNFMTTLLLYKRSDLAL